MAVETTPRELTVENLDAVAGGAEGYAAPAPERAQVEVGGVVATFTLDKKGRS